MKVIFAPKGGTRPRAQFMPVEMSQEKFMPVEMHEVKSSNIAKLGYDQESKTLYVKFLSGVTWSYAEVPEEEYKALSEAESVGKHFAVIRKNPKYVGTKLGPEIEEKS